MIELLISGEDHRHGVHGGFDLIAIVRATARTVLIGRREGASTIDQQLVRVLTGCYDRTMARKVTEIVLAALLADHLPRFDPPEIYLQLGYYGWRMNGLRQACQRLSLVPQELSLEESALLVARLKYPEPRLPSFRRVQQIEARARYLLARRAVHVQLATYDHLTQACVQHHVTAAGALKLVPDC